MVRAVINQLFKLKNIRFGKKVPRVHIIFQNTLGSITPSLLPSASILPGTGTIAGNPAFISHFTGDGRIPVKPRIHSDKSPVRMLFFQSIERVLVGRRKLVDIRASLRKVHRRRHGGQIQIGFFPFCKTLIRRNKIRLFHITRIRSSVPVQKHLIPHHAVTVRFHPRYLHGLSADYRLDGLAFRGRTDLYLIGIAQINGCKNRF